MPSRETKPPLPAQSSHEPQQRLTDRANDDDAASSSSTSTPSSLSTMSPPAAGAAAASGSSDDVCDRLRGVAKVFPPLPPSTPSSSSSRRSGQPSPKGKEWYWDHKTFNVAFFGAVGSGHCHFCYRDTSVPTSTVGHALQIERCHALFNYCDEDCRAMAEYCLPLECKCTNLVIFFFSIED